MNIDLRIFGKTVIEFNIVDGCVENRVFESHKRGKNWVARVTPNMQCPGGLEREFCRHGSDCFYVLPTDLKPGDWLEFGGDYYSCGGSPSRDRQYWRVLTVNEGVYTKSGEVFMAMREDKPGRKEDSAREIAAYKEFAAALRILEDEAALDPAANEALGEDFEVLALMNVTGGRAQTRIIRG